MTITPVCQIDLKRCYLHPLLAENFTVASELDVLAYTPLQKEIKKNKYEV